MIRLLIRLAISLIANAVGLIVAASVLDDVELTTSGFLIAVAIFTLVYALAQPFLTQLAVTSVPALRGGVALIATLISLVITAWLTDGLTITGFTTWILAALIVWLVSLVGALLLPLVMVKKAADENRA